MCVYVHILWKETWLTWQCHVYMNMYICTYTHIYIYIHMYTYLFTIKCQVIQGGRVCHEGLLYSQDDASRCISFMYIFMCKLIYVCDYVQVRRRLRG